VTQVLEHQDWLGHTVAGCPLVQSRAFTSEIKINFNRRLRFSKCFCYWMLLALSQPAMLHSFWLVALIWLLTHESADQLCQPFFQQVKP
jgi:hypothetical protein